jgi:DNA (cytosine-5)-methyltransferase 1
MNIKYISLFSGCGGFDLGFESTGKYECLLNVEIEAKYFNTLQANQGLKLQNGNKFLEHSIIKNANVFAEDVLNHINDISRSNKTWGIIAGPPCQSFSTLGKKGGISDPRGDLTIKFFDLIARFRPSFFVFENVPPLGQKQGIEIRKIIFDILENSGYMFEAKVVNMADYGCYTKRKRFIILGSTKGKIPFPDSTHSEMGDFYLPQWKNCRQALEGLPSPYEDNEFTHHEPTIHSADVLARFESLRPGQYDKVRHRSKLNPDKPGPTLVSGANEGHRNHIHWNSRELSSRECARLHGFPDNFTFYGTRPSVSKQIANSVPVEFGAALGNHIAGHLHS